MGWKDGRIKIKCHFQAKECLYKWLFFIITMIKGDYWVLAGKKIHPKCQNFATYLIVTCFAMHSTVPMMEPSSQTVIRIPLKSIGLPQGNTNFKK